MVLVVRKYAPLDTELEKVEKEARAAKKGLWAGSAAGATLKVAEEERACSAQ
jgi:endonuclease YncB( thermonuclease family)